MSNLGGRPLTIITPATLATVGAVQRGVIVARRSRCGRFITYQAATLNDPETERDVALGNALVVADANMIAFYAQLYGPNAAGQMTRDLHELYPFDLGRV